MRTLVILLNQSRWDHNDLRMCIRSAMINLNHLENIAVIGPDPGIIEWGTYNNIPIFHIPFETTHNNRNPDARLIQMLYAALQHPDVTQQFVAVHPQTCFIATISTKEIQPAIKEHLSWADPNLFSTYWGKRLGRTRSELIGINVTPLWFDQNMPMIFSKKHINETFCRIDYKTSPGICAWSVYGSINHSKSLFERRELARITHKSEYWKINEETAHAKYLSYTDTALNNELKYWMAKQFSFWTKDKTVQPEWEKVPTNDLILLIHQWETTGYPHSLGSRLFVKIYPLKKNESMIYLNNDTYLVNKKIRYHLLKHVTFKD